MTGLGKEIEDLIKIGQKKMRQLTIPRPSPGCLSQRLIDFVRWYTEEIGKRWLADRKALEAEIEKKKEYEEMLRTDIRKLEAENERLKAERSKEDFSLDKNVQLLRAAEVLENVDDDIVKAVLDSMPKKGDKISANRLMMNMQRIKEQLKESASR